MSRQIRVIRCPVVHGSNIDGDLFVPGVGVVKKDGQYTDVGRQFLRDQIEVLEHLIAAGEPSSES